MQCKTYLMKFNFLFIFFCIQVALSQDFSVSGTVLFSGKPVESASILIKDSSVGATTDAEGHFTIHFSNIDNPKLLISYLGKKSRVFPILSNIEDLGIIELKLDETLDEVVVS